MSLKKKINYLNKVKEVQDEFSIYDDGTRPVKGIFNIYIRPKFNIGIRTLYRYIEVRVEKELKKIEDNATKDEKG